jgi:hypothetical protein
MRDHEETTAETGVIELGAATLLTKGEFRRDFVEAPLVIDHWDKP